jgi:hypothetical protein
LVAGGVAALVATGSAAGAGFATTSHGRSVPNIPPVRLNGTSRASFLQATAAYLGTTVAALGREMKSGTTLANIADRTPQRSAKQLAAMLASAATARLEFVANRALSIAQQRSLETSLRRSVTGFLTDTCPLVLAGLREDLGGCPGMATKVIAHAASVPPNR